MKVSTQYIKYFEINGFNSSILLIICPYLINISVQQLSVTRNKMATLLTGSGPLVKELYKATKNYWRLRTNVDFHIIEHCNLKVLEVVGFNPDVHKEHRIYISSLLLLSKIDKSKVESIVAGKNEENIRRRKRVPLQDLQAEALAEMTAEHIISRVHVSVDFEKKEFSFTLNPNIGDDVTEGNCLDFVIAKPTTLLPMIIERQKNSK